MKFLLGLLASLFLALPASAQTALPGPWTVPPNLVAAMQEVELEAWRTACREMKVLCGAWPKPTVTYGLLGGPFGRYELGAHSIQIEFRIYNQQFSYVVMVHEMVHYIQYRLKPDMPGCEAEEQAFRIGMKVALDLNIQDYRIKTWTEMQDQYGCGKLPPRRGDVWHFGTK